MVYSITILLLSANLLVTKCQEDTPDVDTPDFLIEQVSEHTRHTSPSYSYGYGVQDAKTGDLKTAWEEKEGDTVKGHYSVLEPDGSVRTVQYKADAKSGFNAVVKNEKLNDAPMDLFDSEQVSRVQDPGSYSVMESDGSVRTVLYNTKPKTIFKERPKVIPMDAIDVWHLDHATRMQEHTPYSEHSDSVQYKLDADSDSIKKEQPNEQIDFVESLRLDNGPRMQDKSLRDYGKLEPAFDYPAFSSVGETDGKPKFPFEEQKDFPQLWSYRDYLKRLADETDNIKKHNKRGSYKKHKHTSLVELDLSHSKYPDKLTAKETSFGEPTPEHSLEKYLAAQSSDLKNKYTSPFLNSPFRLPNIFGGDFGGLKSLTDKYKHKPEPFSDIHEYVSASEIAQSLPELDILKSKRKPYIKHKYPGLLPLPYAGAASTLEDDFIIIPKKKYLEHSKLIDPSFDSYSHLEHNVRNVDDEYEPHHVHDEKCIHNNEKNKEVIVRKYVKKSKKPVINLLDIFDI